ncbi:hypothetical protein VN97_g2083, partial [Penicillium thymicola]
FSPSLLFSFNALFHSKTWLVTAINSLPPYFLVLQLCSRLNRIRGPI